MIRKHMTKEERVELESFMLERSESSLHCALLH